VAHPEGKPFFVGTYFPREGQQGQPGFLDLCERIADSWDSGDDREEMEHRAQQWTDAATDQLEETPDAAGAGTEAGSSPEPPSSDVPRDGRGRDAAKRRPPARRLRLRPEVPQPSRLRVLARAYDRTGREEYLEVLEEALDAMSVGGLYDHVGGGFHRYCVDRDWTVPTSRRCCTTTPRFRGPFSRATS